MNRLVRDKRGYSMTFWAVYIGAVIVPLIALSTGLGRIFFTRAQLAAAADAAALAAAVEIDRQHFMETGEVILTDQAPVWARQMVVQNSTWLTSKGIYPYVASIGVSGTTVEVTVGIHISPWILPGGGSLVVTVSETGRAEVRSILQ